MVREVDPAKTKRATAFEMWTKAPMPMVTIFKTLDVTKLIKLHKKRGYKFNMLICWCIGKAAAKMEEFYLLPVGEKLMQYDSLAINAVVKTKDGYISTCDIPFSEDLEQFNRDYLELTNKVFESCLPHDLGEGYMIIGTSNLAGHDIDGVVNIYAGFYNNPFMIWGGWRKKFFKTKLPISFQFHHSQMDGLEACEFLKRLQNEINQING
ncbi:MAG: chloramphenicol acetyltransferase [Oscillospiraceae bacterium]|nr:chloramphenicol acetyltransferase [Oscillospiraceae bacterium]